MCRIHFCHYFLDSVQRKGAKWILIENDVKFCLWTTCHGIRRMFLCRGNWVYRIHFWHYFWDSVRRNGAKQLLYKTMLKIFANESDVIK